MLFSKRRMSRYWTRALSTYMLVVLLATIAKDYLPALPLPAELERSENVLWVTAHRELAREVDTQTAVQGGTCMTDRHARP